MNSYSLKELYELKSLSDKAGLKDSDIAVGNNYLFLTLGQIKKRIFNIEQSELARCIDLD